MGSLIEKGSPLAATLHLDRVVAAWEAGKNRICRGAPHVLITHAPKDERTVPAACTIALTYLELATPTFGLGACWAGYLNTAANSWPPGRGLRPSGRPCELRSDDGRTAKI